ncbi:unnamed protein product [Spirodela intermedia]|uniref:Rhodanese domain-containing protein n=1 Tax=Spirodela intermedia TaxID=51605 RepID=A0A7I8IAC0_SPIIN|nr:unnamed protein product [Spirodela intermedia]CAA6654599.1 unnamed protein product [Spirodela intermedia]
MGGCSCDFVASRNFSASGSPGLPPNPARSLQTESQRRILSPAGCSRPNSAAAFESEENPTTPSLVVVSFYKFADFPDHLDFKRPLKDLCQAVRVSGGIILAPEGINGSICGSRESRRLKGLRMVESPVSPEEEALHHGHSSHSPLGAGEDALLDGIISLGITIERVGTYVNPKEWNALITDPDTIVIDVRNTYETRIGKFKGAVDPRTSAFREFPAWVDDQFQLEESDDRDLEQQLGGIYPAEEQPGHRSPRRLPPVAMYCTGGIRCEKASSFLLSKGFKEVCLSSGRRILKYLEEIPKLESLWEGECFVFDKRVSVEHGLAQGSFKLCYGCKQPVSDEDMTSPQWEHGVSCPHCFASKSEEEKERARARQRQFEAWGVIGGPDKGRRSPPRADGVEKKVNPVPHTI